MTRSRTLIFAVLIGSCSSPLKAQQIGRLFHSPAERGALDLLRKAKPQPPKPAAQSAADSQSARLDGYVLRSDGKSTLWVNGNAVSRAR